MKINLICTLILLISISVFGQKKLENDYYTLEIPKETSFEKVKSTKEKLSNVDLYKILNKNNKQTKYLLYLMTNKLNSDIDQVSEYNFKEYLQDIGETEILSNDSIIFDNKTYYKIKVELGNDVKGLIYITSSSGTLYRILFMLPNENYYKKYLNEINLIFKSNKLLNQFN